MGVLTYKGAAAKEALGSARSSALVPNWAQKQGFANNPKAVAGAKLFAQSGCLNCHTYLGAGGSNLGAPDLTAEGAKDKGIDFQIKHLSARVREPGLADAALRGARRRSNLNEARDLPRGLRRARSSRGR